MTMLEADDLLIQVFVLVDDWYQADGHRWRPNLPGPNCRFSDSEMLTLLLVMDYFPYPGEQQFLGYIRANHLALFPHLLDQSQFNRRARRLSGVLEGLRRSWLAQLAVTDEDLLVLDTKPVPVVGYKRSKRHSDFEGSATYGYCASRKLHYFGYKLVLVTTLSGLPLVYDLVPANTDERAAAETVLGNLHGCTILADKGFIGTDWQADVSRVTGNRILTPMRTNQQQQHPPSFNRLFGKFRERIEGVFNEIQNTGRHLEHLLRKKVSGICTHVAAKVTSHTLRVLLREQFGIDVLTFEQHPVRNGFTLT